MQPKILCTVVLKIVRTFINTLRCSRIQEYRIGLLNILTNVQFWDKLAKHFWGSYFKGLSCSMHTLYIIYFFVYGLPNGIFQHRLAYNETMRITEITIYFLEKEIVVKICRRNEFSNYAIRYCPAQETEKSSHARIWCFVTVRLLLKISLNH